MTPIYNFALLDSADGDCNGVYIDNQCHTFWPGDMNWADAEAWCARTISVVGYTGAHLTSIATSAKQEAIEQLMDRFGIRRAWVGGTNKPLLWKWVSNQQDVQAQGCYNDSQAFSYKAQIAGISSEGCIDACKNAGYGYAGVQVTHLSSSDYYCSNRSVSRDSVVDPLLLFVQFVLFTTKSSALTNASSTTMITYRLTKTPPQHSWSKITPLAQYT